MSKPALFYAVIRRGWTSFGGFAVMKVTKETKGLLYGSIDDIPTHIRTHDMKGIKFTTQEQADTAFLEIKKLYDAYENIIKDAQSKVDDLKREREDEIRKLFIKPEPTNVVAFSNRKN